MRKVKVITDSTCDLPSDIIEKFDIAITPLYVDFGEESYKDGVTLFPEQLFQLVREKGILPKTAAPSPYDFIKQMREYVDLDLDIIVITISAKMSSTYQNALLAASELPAGRIRVIDSQNITMGIGSQVMIAGEMAKEGKSLSEIADRVKDITPKAKVSFVIDTLEYLYKGGRCNVVQNLLGTALRIRPIIGVEDGSMIVENKVRGDKKRALDKIVDEVIKNSSKINFNRIFVLYSCGSEEEADYVKDSLHRALPGIELPLVQAGCVISSHCGEKTLGISYIEK